MNRTACLVERISEFKWRVAAGEAVAHFLGANGPPEIVSYNWNKVKSLSCPVTVCRELVVPDGQRFAHHDFADLLRLTSLGERQLRKPEEKQDLVYTLQLACSGASHGLPKRTHDPTNCARVCCGALGSTTCSCKQKRHQACSVRVHITAQHSSSETHSCIFTSDDLGLAFVPCGLFGVQVVACMKRRDGSPGPAPHTGSALSPGDLVTRIDGVADLSRCVEKSGKLSLAIAPPITLHFKRSWRHVGDESSESHIDDAAVPAGGTWKDGDVYIVESILKSRQADESTEYLCKWEGWSDEYNSWEPEANILDELLIEDYLRRTGKERPEPMSDSSEDLMEEAVTQPTMKAAATGRPAKRKPKFPSQRPAGAPRRRGKKPCRRRPDDFPMLEVPPASLSMCERATICKERLLAVGEDEAVAAQECVDSMTYVE